MGLVGRVQTQVKDGKKVVSMYVTKDAEIKKGDTIYFNEVKETYDRLAQHNVISPAEAIEKVENIKAQDAKYDRVTKYMANLFRKKNKDEQL